MPEQALYLKWRPQRFGDMVGQEHIVRTLRNSLKTGRIRHAYLFSGPRGTGKTSSARLLAKAVNCTHDDIDMRPCNECAHCIAVNEGRFLDLIEIDAASHTGVDDVRELRDRIAFAPGEGRYKVYIIDEVHRFSGSAFDALLKTLEEPPDHALFILATTEIDRVPATIKSRCLPFEFRRLSLHEVVDRLAAIAESEGIQIEREALELIAREGTGSVRDSISLLDQVVADPEEVITLELAQRILGTANLRAVRDIVDALVMKDVPRGIHIINTAIDSGSDPRQLGYQILDHLRSVMLAQTAGLDLIEAAQADRELFSEQARQIDPPALLRAIRAFNEAASSSSGSWQPQLALELAFIESLQEPQQVMVAAAPAAFEPTGRAAQPASVPPEFSEPGAPPVVPVDVVRGRWIEAQRLIHQYAPTSNDDKITNLPTLMEFVSVLSVDGAVINLSVNNKAHFKLLGDTTRTRWIERAIMRVTGVEHLRVRFHLVEGGSSEESSAPVARTAPVDDPVIEMGLELGGEISDDEDEEI